jgi:hypothetical protein
MTKRSFTIRVLAIDPTTKGFAYAVFEGPSFLLDWGLTQVDPERKNTLCLERIEDLLKRYDPGVLALEACNGKGSRRASRVQALIRSIERLATRKRFRSRAFSRGEIRKAFDPAGKATRKSIAVEIARRFPELSPRLPRFRTAPRLPRQRVYDREVERMSIFDAAALAVTYFETNMKRLRSTAEATQPTQAE